MPLSFLQWSAWAPGVATKEEWLSWVSGSLDFNLSESPDVSFIKPMVRRRLSSLAKMVFATSNNLLDDNQKALPLVFASRFGEMDKTVQLLTNLTNDEGLSPTSFGLSVHNSLVGMYGMINKWTKGSTAIGAGKRSLSSGFIEAFSQSKSLETPVLYFYYDEPLPEIYSSYSDDESITICIGVIVDAAKGATYQLHELVMLNPEILPVDFIKLLIEKNA